MIRQWLLRLGFDRRKVDDPTRCTYKGTGPCTRCGLTVFEMLAAHAAVCPEYGGRSLHHVLMAMGPKCVPWQHVERRAQ